MEASPVAQLPDVIPPASWTVVMGSGVVSIDLSEDHQVVLSAILFNAAYERHFPGPAKPVRTTVRADLVAGMLVEVTVIAGQPRR